MKKIVLLICLAILCFAKSFCQSDIAVTNLKCEYEVNPIGIDAGQPRLSWQLTSGKRNQVQAAYQVLVATSPEKLVANNGDAWNSKKIKSDKSIQVEYKGTPLQSTTKYYWKVKVWNQSGQESSWSEIASWQMGLLSSKDWGGAQWIAYEKLPDSARIVPTEPSGGKLDQGKDTLPMFRKEFSIKKQLKQATMFICGLGHFEMHLNGKTIGDHFLDPGWTLYDKQALYVAFDLTGQLKQGNNTLGVMLGNGFYYIPQERYRKLTCAFGYPKMICKLVFEYQDGTSEDVVSDSSWRTAPGPITFSSIYGGEDYDANLEQPGWDSLSFNDKSWKMALIVDGPKVLNAQTAPPLKIFENFTPQKISQPKPGIWVYDLGQNASGIPQISVKGNKGSFVKISPGELLDKNGLVSQKSTGGPCYYKYTLSGKGIETWQPRFTYYGFRYLQVEGGIPYEEANSNDLPVITGIKGLHTRSSVERVGAFSCSNDLFNRINKLINWAIESNMASLFTDCPHREKLGWLEEVYLAGNSIQYNYDIANLCRKTIQDMKTAQTPDGLVPDIAPEYVRFRDGYRDSPEWGSCSVILPWYLYQWYGDKQVLKDNYDMMQRYVGFLQKKSVDYILSYGLGDWCDLGPKPPGYSQNTPKGLTSTAIFYYDICILKKVANLLGNSNDVAKYDQLSSKVKDAFNKDFFNKEMKYYGTNSQAANAIGIYMDLVASEYKDSVVANLIKDIRGRNNSLTTGEVGFHYLLKVLENEGRSDVVYDMNNRTDVPGYGYQLEHGSTSLSETWQGLLSNNHFMLGHLMEWFYTGLGGIKQADSSVAYKTIVLHPDVIEKITGANVKFKSPYGLIRSEWKKNNGEFEYAIEVPANTTAFVYLPSAENEKITESDNPADKVKDIEFVKRENGESIYKVGSGSYRFKISK